MSQNRDLPLTAREHAALSTYDAIR